MTELEKNTAELNNLIIKGESVKAISLFYADDVTMHENEDEPRIGKQACLAHEKQNMQNVKAVYSVLLNQAINVEKNIVFSEWEIIFITTKNEKLKLTEVAIQHWNKGKIIKEKFYYKNFYPAI